MAEIKKKGSNPKSDPNKGGPEVKKKGQKQPGPGHKLKMAKRLESNIQQLDEENTRLAEKIDMNRSKIEKYKMRLALYAEWKVPSTQFIQERMLDPETTKRLLKENASTEKWRKQFNTQNCAQFAYAVIGLLGGRIPDWQMGPLQQYYEQLAEGAGKKKETELMGKGMVFDILEWTEVVKADSAQDADLCLYMVPVESKHRCDFHFVAKTQDGVWWSKPYKGSQWYMQLKDKEPPKQLEHYIRVQYFKVADKVTKTKQVAVMNTMARYLSDEEEEEEAHGGTFDEDEHSERSGGSGDGGGRLAALRRENRRLTRERRRLRTQLQRKTDAIKLLLGEGL